MEKTNFFDQNSFSERELSVSVWWVTHRSQLRRWWVAGLAIGDIALGLFLFAMVLRLFVTWPSHERMIASIGQFPVKVSAISGPEDLTLSGVTVRGDWVMSTIENSNTDWFVPRLEYHFVQGDKKTDSKQTFLYPAQTFFVGHEKPEGSQNEQWALVMDLVEWHRLSANEKEDLPQFIVSQPQLSIVDVKNDGRATIIRADITNRNPENLVDVPCTVVVKDDNQNLLAVREQSLPKIVSGATVEFVMRIPEALVGAREVIVQPRWNVFE